MSNYKRAPQNPNNFVSFDFETGGTNSAENPVTEIALISITGDKLETIGSYQSLIAPYSDTLIYDPRAEKVSGISREMVEAEGQPIRLVAEQTIAMMEQANTRQEKNAGLRPILIGHNTQFDIAFLTHLMYYGFLGTKTDYQKELERVLHGRRDHYGNFQPSYFDTWSLGKAWFQAEAEMDNFKLATLVDKLGVDLNNAHRAMNDTLSTLEVFRRCIVNLRSSYKENHKGQREGFQFPI